MKNLDPERYGGVDVAKYMTAEELMDLNDAFSAVIVDSEEETVTPIDVDAAERMFDEIVLIFCLQILHLVDVGLIDLYLAG